MGMWLYRKRALQSPVGNLNLSTAISDKPAEYVVTGVIPPGEARYLRAVVRTRRIPQQVSVFMDGAELKQRPADQASIYAVEPSGMSYQIDEPLLGLGFGRETQYVWQGVYYRVKGDPDNSYVFLLAGGGILALGGFLLLLWGFVRDAFSRLRFAVGSDRGLVIWALSAWFILAVNFAMGPVPAAPEDRPQLLGRDAGARPCAEGSQRAPRVEILLTPCGSASSQLRATPMASAACRRIPPTSAGGSSTRATRSRWSRRGISTACSRQSTWARPGISSTPRPGGPAVPTATPTG